MFVQSHIIAQFFNKINPYFEKIFILFLKNAFCRENLVKTEKRMADFPVVKIAKGRKSDGFEK
jgi:hypothetical protein